MVVSSPIAQAEIYLQGGHLATWVPRGHRPVLFLSSTSLYQTGKAIRGGVPVIFPWFGARSDGQPGPQHGFARTALWKLESTDVKPSGDAEIVLSLPDSGARLRFRIGAVLHMELEVRNTGAAPMKYEEALHTYFAVSDIGQTSVTGLEDVTYVDKTDGFVRKRQAEQPLRLTKETDSVYLDTPATCVIHDTGWNRRIIVEKSGSASTIVWNPWQEKSAAMADMGPGEWRQMICVESGNAADNAVTLAPGETHSLTVTIRVD